MQLERPRVDRVCGWTVEANRGDTGARSAYAQPPHPGTTSRSSRHRYPSYGRYPSRGRRCRPRGSSPCAAQTRRRRSGQASRCETSIVTASVIRRPSGISESVSPPAIWCAGASTCVPMWLSRWYSDIAYPSCSTTAIGRKLGPGRPGNTGIPSANSCVRSTTGTSPHYEDGGSRIGKRSTPRLDHVPGTDRGARSAFDRCGNRASGPSEAGNSFGNSGRRRCHSRQQNKPSKQGKRWRPREESNLRAQLRRLPLYPLSYGALREYAAKPRLRGVTDGTRTHNHRDHNPGLYQLSYGHRAANSLAPPEKGTPAEAGVPRSGSARSVRSGRARECSCARDGLRRTPRPSSR